MEEARGQDSDVRTQGKLLKEKRGGFAVGQKTGELNHASLSFRHTYTRVVFRFIFRYNKPGSARLFKSLKPNRQALYYGFLPTIILLGMTHEPRPRIAQLLTPF